MDIIISVVGQQDSRICTEGFLGNLTIQLGNTFAGNTSVKLTLIDST